VVLRGDPAACIPALAADLGAELHVDEETTTIAASELPFSTGELPDVFSNFRHRPEAPGMDGSPQVREGELMGRCGSSGSSGSSIAGAIVAVLFLIILLRACA
jgi:hypothetical protein